MLSKHSFIVCLITTYSIRLPISKCRSISIHTVTRTQVQIHPSGFSECPNSQWGVTSGGRDNSAWQIWHLQQERPVCVCGRGRGDLETPRECLTEMLYSSTCVDDGEPAIYPTI